MRSSFKLGRIAGIEIGIHYTWILAFLLIAWSLAIGFFPAIVPARSLAIYWILAVVASILLFVSVLLHELAHSLAAKFRGLNVPSITLFIFGGVSNLEEEPQKAKTEFFMAIAGPLTSLLLCGVLWGVGLPIGVHGNPFAVLTGNIPSLNSPATALIYYLSSINLILGLFNLIPAFPLDGGRVLRSAIWEASKDLKKSTNIAATVGRYSGWAFIGYGVFTFVQGDYFGGLWIAFIGWFIASAAGASRRAVMLRDHVTGLLVKEVMNTNPVIIDSTATIEALVRDVFLRYHCRAAVVSNNNQTIGILTVDDIKKVHKDKWGYTTVEQIMTREPLYSVSPEDDFNTLMRLFARHNIKQLLVLKAGELVGLVDRADVVRHLEITQELSALRKQDRD
jgi:Zn-dependent protease/CBS domain-containing protein